MLAGLSAAAPLTVPEPSLYTANAIAPTAGTRAAAVAAFLGVGLRQALGGGDTGSVVVLCITAGVFVVAGLLATRVKRGQFGPGSFDATPALNAADASFFSERCYLPQAVLGRLLDIYDQKKTTNSRLTEFVKDMLRLDALDALSLIHI